MPSFAPSTMAAWEGLSDLQTILLVCELAVIGVAIAAMIRLQDPDPPAAAPTPASQLDSGSQLDGETWESAPDLDESTTAVAFTSTRQGFSLRKEVDCASRLYATNNGGERWVAGGCVLEEVSPPPPPLLTNPRARTRRSS